MRIRNAAGAALITSLSGISVLALAAGPAHAQAAEPCPAGQPPGRTPGNPTSGPATGRPTQYPPGKCELRLSRSVVAAGGSLQAAGAGFAPGSTVEVSLSGASLTSAGADGDGAFSTPLVVPASTKPGTHTVAASGPAAGGGTQVLSASLEVTRASDAKAAPAGGAGGGSSLPRTGSSSTAPLVLAGGFLLVVGAATLVAARNSAAARH